MKHFAIILAFSLLHTETLAEDTYNFYFQKAPGPVTVNQGTSSNASTPNTNIVPPPQTTTTTATQTSAPQPGPTPTVVPAAAPAVAATQQTQEQTPTGKQWSFGLFFWKPTNREGPRTDLISRKPNVVNSSYLGITLERTLSTAFSIFGEFSKSFKTNPHCEKCGYDFYQEDPQSTPEFTYGAGAAYEFISNLNKGHALAFSLSGIAGIMTVPQYTYIQTRYGIYDDYYSAFGFDNKAQFYFGPKLKILIADTTSIDTSYRVFPGLAQAGRHRGAIATAISYHF